MGDVAKKRDLDDVSRTGVMHGKIKGRDLEGRREHDGLVASEVVGQGHGDCRVIGVLGWVAADRWLLKRGRSVHVAKAW